MRSSTKEESARLFSCAFSRRSARLGLLLAVALAFVLLLARPARATTMASSFHLEPAPSWVTPAEEGSVAPRGAGADGVRGGVVDALVDDQIRVGTTVEHYVHRIRRVLSITGLETAGEVEIAIDPSYEELVLHKIQIVRGTKRIDVLRATTVRTLQNDTGDERTYNDRITHVFLVPDIRVGDTLDYEYSVRGQNAVFGGRFVRSFSLLSMLRAERHRLRLVTATGRVVRTAIEGSKISPTARDVGADHELVWEWRNLPAAHVDAGTAHVDAGAEDASDEMFARVHMSEFADWAEVAAWGVTLFDRQLGSSPLLDARVREIHGANKDALGEAVMALDFVQKEIRYLGVEAGEHSHLPHTAPEVLAQRFGDCKDKSLLLVALLRALGIEAHVALVSPTEEAEVKEQIPGPLAFGHAVVRIRIAGRTYFVDPTISHQSGTLEARSTLPYGVALVLAAGTTQLDDIPVATPAEPTVETSSVYGLGPGPDEASLEVETTFRGADADRRREEMEEVPRADIQKTYLRFYKAEEPTARPVGEISITDDVAANVLVIRERYAIPGFWSDGKAAINAASLGDRLSSPGRWKRTSPLHVQPIFTKESIDVHFRDGRVPELPALKLGNAWLTYTRTVQRVGSVLHLTFELRSDAHAIAPDAVPAYANLVDAIRKDLAWTLPETAKPHVDKPWTREDWYALGAVLGVVLLVMLVAALRRLRFIVRRRRYRRGARIGAGESAPTAIDVAGRAGADKVMARARCSCGGALSDAATPFAWSEIRLGARTIQVARGACVACGQVAARYFHVKA